MSAARKIGATAAAVVLTAGIGLTASAPADAGSEGIESRTVLPFSGSYHGSDFHGRPVSFQYGGGHIHLFKVNGHFFLSGAPVQGHQVHHFCEPRTNKCIRGHWVTDTQFDGHWNDPQQGHSVSFTARLFSH